MVLSLLSLFTPMIKRLTCLPNLLTVNTSNSFVKTLVLSPWDDPFLSSSPLMHLHLVLCFALFNMFLFVYIQFLFILFLKKKNEKIIKIQKQYVFCVHWYLYTLDGH